MSVGSVTSGDHVSAVELDGFRLTEVSYRAGVRLPAHTHNYAAMAIPICGTFVHTVPDRVFACKASGLLIKPVLEVHSDDFGPSGVRCLLVEPTESRIKDVQRHSAKLFRTGEYVENDLVGRLGAQIYNEFRRPDPLSALSLEGLLLEILAAASRAMETGSREQPDWLVRARKYLDGHYRKPVRIRDAAAAAGVHQAHLSIAFRRYFDRSPSDYVRSLRINAAKQDLLHTQKRISAIAFEVGFCDQSHLTRAFKRETGITPASYRRSSRLDIGPS